MPTPASGTASGLASGSTPPSASGSTPAPASGAAPAPAPGIALTREPVAESTLASLFAFGGRLPDLDPAALDLSARPKDLVLLGFAQEAEETARRIADGGDVRGSELVRDLRAALVDTFATAAEAQRDRARGLGASAELLDLAERCCLLYAGAAAVLAWRAHPDRRLYGDEPGGSGWLTAVLAVLLALADGRDPRQAATELPPAVRALTRLDAAGLLFTAFPVQLSDERPEPDEGHEGDETT
ncbi:hypothetical protein ACIQI8_38870 [Streptomyces sp. NPDC092369]|uniref:hypothetical protein n=1 Tax=Streptomyces sp. NPDC092369 TaxID=3366015 RepID=UPI0038044430